MAEYSETAFITDTNNGKVLNEDRSRTIETSRLTLTREEIEERRAWNNLRSSLMPTFEAMAAPMCTTVDQVLNHRVPPPLMGIDDASQRTAASGQRNRYYFPQLSAWADFETGVENFQVDRDLRLTPSRVPPLPFFLLNEFERMVTESDEMQYLVRVIRYLQNLDVHLEHRTSTNAIGDMDRALSYINGTDADGAVRRHLIAPIECKSTQNLLLPLGATEIADAYNEGYMNMTTQGFRSATWCHVCRPLAQLFRQLKNNSIRFGVLTSATRTYFVRVCDTSRTDTTPRVYVSRSYLLGEQNYLRAWAHFAHLARTAADGQFTCPENWGLASTPSRAVNEIDEHNDNESDYVSSEVISSQTLRLASWLPFVSVGDLVIMDPIGYGRNGAVFRVRWEGQEYALKQFDTATAIGLRSFIRESQAYALLQDVWGVLVPKPMFLSELGDATIKFLGLQLGRAPTAIECDSTSFATDSRKVIQKLYHKFGFEHLDAEVLRNWLYVPTGEIAKPERLVVTDLEDYRSVPTRSMSSKKRPRSAPKSLHRPETVL